jgi:hypothetical protein
MLAGAICRVCLCLAMHAAAPAAKNGKEPEVAAPEYAESLRAADEAWKRSSFGEARRILEPLAADIARVKDPQDREQILLLLADSALNDPILDVDQRRAVARKQLELLMDADRDWQLAKGKYTNDLYDFYVDLRIARAGRQAAECEGRRISCGSDLETAQDKLAAERKRYLALETKYNEQEVEVREQVARTRILAALPLGFGHFYNAGVGSRRRRGGAAPSRGDRIDLALGATFLAAEAAVGLTGLALLIRRTVVDGCRRSKGFQSGSLVCDRSPEARDGIIRRRKAEEVMAWTLLGVAVTDIIIAQVLFEEVETRSVTRVRRRDLDRNPGGESAPRRAAPKRRAKVRAAPSFGPSGGGFTLHVRF